MRYGIIWHIHRHPVCALIQKGCDLSGLVKSLDGSHTETMGIKRSATVNE